MKRSCFVVFCIAAVVAFTALVPSVGAAQNQWTDWLLNGTVVDGGNGWRWYPIKGAQCRDGSDTGIAIRAVSGSTKIVIMMQGGGACYNGTTCLLNPSKFGVSEFMTASNSTSSNLTDGMFRSTPANEFSKYTQVFVPYCSGDLHAGNGDAYVNGVTDKQHFYGYNNSKVYFNYVSRRFIEPYGSQVKEVLLAGFSAGGYGAVLNAPQLRKRLASGVAVSVLDDSGPFFDNTDGKLAAACLQDRWYNTWNVATLLSDAGCPNCTSTRWLNPFFMHFLGSQRSVPLAFTSSTNDAVIQTFMGYSQLFCGHDATEAEYRAGLLALRAQMVSTRTAEHNVATFYIDHSNKHCSIQNASYYTTVTAEGAPIQPWVEALFYNPPATSHTSADYTQLGLPGQ